MYNPSPYRYYLERKDLYQRTKWFDFERTAGALLTALGTDSYIIVTACQLMCLSRVSGLTKFRLNALSEYLEEKYRISIGKIPSDSNIRYIVAKTAGMQPKTDEELKIEPNCETFRE